MFTHPDLMWAQLKQRESDRLAEADAYRLLAAVRRNRRARGAAVTNGAGGGGPDRALVPARPAGNLAECTPDAVAPAH
jgi:hypothetical protein